MKHTEKVKSYAPRVLHVVADLHIQLDSDQTSGGSNVHSTNSFKIDSKIIHSMAVGATVGAVVPDRKRSNKADSISSKIYKDNNKNSSSSSSSNNTITTTNNNSITNNESSITTASNIALPELDAFQVANGSVPVINMNAKGLNTEEQVNAFLRAATQRRIPVIFRALDVGPAVGKLMYLYLEPVLPRSLFTERK